MKHYVDTVQNTSGQALPGISVTVRIANATPGTGALAAIYSDDGVTTTGNPVATNANGTFDFYAADGKYDLTYTGANYTTKIIAAQELADVTEVGPGTGDLAWAAKSLSLTGALTSYNGVATVANGIPALLATVNLTAQAAAIAPVTVYAVPSTGAGNYNVSWMAKVTQAATTSCVLGGANGFQLVYTDKDDSVVVTTPAWWGGGNNGSAPTSAAVNTTQNVINGQFSVSCKASTNLQFSIGYTSVGGTVMNYNLHIRVEYLG